MEEEETLNIIMSNNGEVCSEIKGFGCSKCFYYHAKRKECKVLENMDNKIFPRIIDYFKYRKKLINKKKIRRMKEILK